MPAVTQLIPNFLGGVSRQNDDKKLLGQVTECINGYPDPTYGLLKRPGMKHTNVLKKANGTAFTKAELDGAAWFFIERDAAGSYIGAIKGANIYVWTSSDGTWCTVTNNASSYLTGRPVKTVDTIVGGTGYANAVNVSTTGGTGTGLTVDITTSGGVISTVTVNNAGTGYSVNDTISVTGGNSNGTFDVNTIDSITLNDYHFRSVQDVTVITNKTIAAAMQPNNTYTAKSVATLKLNTLVETYTYTVTIQHVEATVTALNNTTFDDMLLYDASGINFNHHLVDKIKQVIEAEHTANNADFAGRWYLEGYPDSLVIKRSTGANAVVVDYSAVTGTPVAFDIDAKGGLNNTAIEAFEDEVVDVTKLPLESFGGHSVTISNTSNAEDDYHLQFVAYDAVLNRGRGYWEETIARDVSPGLNASTMPHQLENTGPTTFTFNPISWTARQAGNDVTSPLPSFIGKKITATFFYSNRFGLLSQDNVFFGVANDNYNFFVKSALTQIDSDPIDLNVSSIRPVTLSEVLPSPQGLMLFSERQQFQVLATDSSTLTPSTTLIRSLSNYEMSPDIAPVDVGVNAAFVNRVPGYSKLFSLQLRDVEQPPLVVDISKIVLEWIPDTVDGLTVSPQNSVIMLIDRSTSYLYLYRYYNNGEKDLFQAWTKWQLPGTIQTADIINDSVVVVSQHEDEYTIGKIILDEIPTGSSVVGTTSITGNTCLDMATRPAEPAVGVSAVVYDAANGVTKIYTPYTPIQQKEAIMLLSLPTADVGTNAVVDADAGFYLAATERTEIGTGYRYFEVNGDYTSYADGIVIGYGYDFEVTMPKFYYKRDPNTSDYTATLTISRVTFSVGRTGPVLFKVKAAGSDEWKNVEYVTDAETYVADSSPIAQEHQFTVPIHQRNTNFELKVTSNFPYPVSLVSMTWEGNYSPRFYRRA